MTSVKELTTMCRAGHIAEAYDLAKVDFDASPQNIWAQRGLGWVLYYCIKSDVEEGKTLDVLSRLEELAGLNLLTIQNDALIFNNVLWKLAELIKALPKENVEYISRVFSFVRHYTFMPFNGYSFFLKVCMHFEAWNELVLFFEWWNLDNLLPEDYLEFKTEAGRKIMSLSEQAYIAYSKALLKLNDKQKIQEFVPKIEKLMEDYPNMMYPGYFCGKLLLALGADESESLKIVVPFVRKKRGEFWVWQLLSDIFKSDIEMRLACLLRAVHCKTKEEFLGKVRMNLISLYLSLEDYPRAKFHLDNVVRCYMQHGWNLPLDVQDWIRQSWVQNIVSDSTDKIEYLSLTNGILRMDCNSSVAVVTYVDNEKKRTSIIYGERKRTFIRKVDIPFKVKNGELIKLYWQENSNGNIDVVSVESIDGDIDLPNSYIKKTKGKIDKKNDKPFAFIRDSQGKDSFVSPSLVEKYKIRGDEYVSALLVLDFNKKKEEWNWVCLSLKNE